MSETKLPFFTLLLMISFAAVNAVLFTPALPDIAHFFSISNNVAEYTITWFLIGYAVGQLVYGPLANRFGRKPALYVGVGIQMISSLLCVLAGVLHEYPLLVITRFLLALGSGVGLNMAFTLVNECYAPEVVSQKVSYLMLSFAVAPGLGIALGGVLNTHFGWMSCFYAGAVYGLILFLLLRQLPETQAHLDQNALKIKHLLQTYSMQFKNRRLVASGLLMGCATTFIYMFAGTAPFIAMNLFGMTSTEYGMANTVPLVGLILGFLFSAKLALQRSPESIIRLGVLIVSVGVILMIILMTNYLSAMISLFLPMIMINFGLSLILPNASTLAMSQASDKSHGSAVMGFINMGFVTCLILMLGFFSITAALLLAIFMSLSIAMMVILPFCGKISSQT